MKAQIFNIEDFERQIYTLLLDHKLTSKKSFEEISKDIDIPISTLKKIINGQISKIPFNDMVGIINRTGHRLLIEKMQ